MARYDDSWKTNIKSMFAPLPVDYMAEKLADKQAERDYYQQQISGDLNLRWDLQLTNDDGNQAANQFMQDYKNDLNSIQEELDGTLDFNNVSTMIDGIRDKYSISDPNAINYSSTSTGSGTGSGNTSSTTANNFVHGSAPWKMATNLDNRLAAEEEYNQSNQPNTPMYRWWYIDKVAEQAMIDSGGNPLNQDLIEYDVVVPYDESVMDKSLTSMTKGFNADGTASQYNIGDYTGIFKDKYVLYGEVFGDKTSGAMGYILQDTEWNAHKDIEYAYGVEVLNNIDPNELVDQSLWTSVKDDYVTTYGIENWETHYNNDLNDGLINDKINDKFETEVDNYAQQYYNRSFDQLDEDTQATIVNIVRDDLARNQYKYNQAFSKVDEHARRESFYIYDITNYQESVDSKRQRARDDADYTYKINNPTSTTATPVVTEDLDPNTRKQVVLDSFNNDDNLRNNVTNANTDLNTSNQNLTDLLVQDQAGLFVNATTLNYNPLYGLQGDMVYDNDKVLDIAIDNGIIVQNTDGTIAVNSTLPNASNYTSVVTKYNEDLRRAQVAQQSYVQNNANQYAYKQSWINGDDGQMFINDFWNRNNVNGTVTIQVNGKEVILDDKSDLNKYILNGDVITATRNNQGVTFSAPWSSDVKTYDFGANNFNKKVATYNADNPVGLRHLSLVTWNNTKDANIFGQLTAIENLYSTANTLASQTDINGVPILDGLGIDPQDMDLYTYKSEIRPFIGTDGDAKFSQVVTATPVDGGNTDIDKVTNSFIVSSDNLNNQTGLGATIIDATLTTAYGNLNNKNLQNITWDGQLTNEIETELNIIASVSPNVNRTAIFSNDVGVDLVQNFITNSNDGDFMSTPIYNSDDGSKFYVKNIGNGLGQIYMKDNNGDYYETLFNPVADGDGVFTQTGRIDYHNKTTNNPTQRPYRDYLSQY